MKPVLKQNLGLMNTCLWRKILQSIGSGVPRVRISRTCIRRNLPAKKKKKKKKRIRPPCGSVTGRFHCTLFRYDERLDSMCLWKEGIMWTIGTAWPLKTGTIGCSETSVNNYQVYLTISTALWGHNLIRIIFKAQFVPRSKHPVSVIEAN